MGNKKKIIIIITVLVVALSAFGVYLFTKQKAKNINNKETESLIEDMRVKNKVATLTGIFVSTWGTYSYKNFSKEYPQKLKPYLTNDFYEDTFSNKESIEIRWGRMIGKKYSINTRILQVTAVESKGNGVYDAKALVEEKVSSTEENYTKRRKITIVWEKTGEDYKVSRVDYELDYEYGI